MSNALLPLCLLGYGALCLYGPLATAEPPLVHADPLYQLLIELTARMGLGSWAPLAVGMACGAAAIVASERLLRSVVGAHAAPGALVLLSLAPFFVGQTRADAPATWALLLVVLSYVLFWEYLRGGHPAWISGWLAVSALAIGAHTGLVFLALLQGFVLLFYRERYPQRHALWWPLWAAGLAAFVWIFWEQMPRFFSASLPATSAAQWLQAPHALALLITNMPPPNAFYGAALFALLLGPGLWACSDWRKDARRALLVGGLITPCLLYVIRPEAEELLIAALPLLSGLCAMGLRSYPRWARQGLWFTILLAYSWSYWNLYN